MKVPLLAGFHLAKQISQSEAGDFQQKIEFRLDKLGHSGSALEKIVENLEFLVDHFFESGIDVADWPELSEEYGAFFSWLLMDMSVSQTSQDFNKKLRFEVASHIRSKSNPETSVSDLRTHLQLQAWIVGTPTSIRREDCAVSFPLRAIGAWSDNSSLAYRGLVHQMHLIESLHDKNYDPIAGEFHFQASNHEMAITSIPVRVMALAEALVNSRNVEVNDQGGAITKQVQKLRGQVRAAVEKDWGSSSSRLQELRLDRNSIAHIWSREGDPQTFADVVNRLDLDYAQELGVLASYLVAAELSNRLQDFGERRVIQWFEQVEDEIGRHLAHI